MLNQNFYFSVLTGDNDFLELKTRILNIGLFVWFNLGIQLLFPFLWSILVWRILITVSCSYVMSLIDIYIFFYDREHQVSFQWWLWHPKVEKKCLTCVLHQVESQHILVRNPLLYEDHIGWKHVFTSLSDGYIMQAISLCNTFEWKIEFDIN